MQNYYAQAQFQTTNISGGAALPIQYGKVAATLPVQYGKTQIVPESLLPAS